MGIESEPTESLAPRGTRFEVIGILLFVLLNLAGPFLLGECFPFTIAPMFCQEPEHFCEFELFDLEGNPLPLEAYALQRIYDGNPPGLGVGICPPKSFDRFGQVPSEEELRSHLFQQLEGHPELAGIQAICRVIGAIDDQHVGELEDERIEITVRRDDLPSQSKATPFSAPQESSELSSLSTNARRIEATSATRISAGGRVR